MRWMVLPLWLVLACPVLAQDRLDLGQRPSKEQIEEALKKAKDGQAAEAFLNLAKGKVVKQIEVGQAIEFQLKSDALWLWNGMPFDPEAKYPTARIDVKANQDFALTSVDKASGTAEIKQFPPQPNAWGMLYGCRAGKVTITVIASGEGGGPPVITNVLEVTVGKPVPPTPPGPEPPGPGPVPIPTEGLRVLFVTESGDGWPAIIRAQEVRDYLNAKCIKVGNQPEWRVFDPQQDVSNESKIWQDAMKIERKSLPWLIISNGTSGYSDALPATKDELMRLLKQYGGQ